MADLSRAQPLSLVPRGPHRADRRIIVAEAGAFTGASPLGQELSESELRSLLASCDLEIMPAAAELLSALAVECFHLVLFEDPAAPLGTARLIFTFRDGARVDLGSQPILFPAREVLPWQLSGLDDREFWLVEPLPTADDAIGYVVLSAQKYDPPLLVEALRVLGKALAR